MIIQKTNIKTGLDITGGSRALVQAKDVQLNSDELNDLVDITRNRINVYGISDVKVLPVSDLSGNRFMLIEIAGATPKDLEELVENKLTDGLLEGSFINGDTISICKKNGEIVLTKKKIKVSKAVIVPKSQITKIQTYTSKMVACRFICWRGGTCDEASYLCPLLAQVSAGYRSCFHARTIHEAPASRPHYGRGRTEDEQILRQHHCHFRLPGRASEKGRVYDHRSGPG